MTALSAQLAMALQLQRPWWLVALIACILPWVLARRSRHRGRSVSPVSIALQTVALALLAIALAGPAVPIGSGNQPVLLLQDESGSVRNQPAFSPPVEVPVRTVRFAAGLAVDPAAELSPNATRLAGALQWASSVSPPPSAVLIRTDGRFQDDIAAYARALEQTGVPVAVLPMTAPPPDARIAEFRATRRPDGNVALVATVAANASMSRTLEIRRTSPTDELLTRRPLTLRAGDYSTARLMVSLPRREEGTFIASLSPRDAVGENDSLATAVLPLEHRVALLAPGGPVGRWLAAGLDGAEVLDASSVKTPASLLPYSAVVVIDPGGESLSPPTRQALGRYVRTGGGLVVVGSGPRRSPADANDPLARALPVSFQPWRRSRLDIRLLLDASGSMGQHGEDAEGRSRRPFDQAVEAALAMNRHLTPADRISVWTFADTPRLRYRSGDRRPDFARLRTALRAVRPAGATDAGQALSAALNQPTALDANGLVVLLTDLQTRPLDVDALTGAFRASGNQLAIVATGDAPDTHRGALQLQRLADRTGASLVRSDTLAGLAKVFARFVKRSRGDALRIGRFAPVASAPVFGLPVEGWPSVSAYLSGRARDGAQVLLSTRVDGEPLVARWQVGAGSAVCVALQADRLTRDDRWSGLVASAVRWARRAAVDSRFSAEITREKGTIAVELYAVDADGLPINDLSLRTRLTGMTDPSADTRASLVQVGPGVYHAALSASPGPAYLTIADAEGRTVYRQAIGGALAREFAEIGPDRSALADLARRTSGRVIVRDSQLAAFLQAARSRDRSDLTVLALLLSVCAMLIDWALVRVTRRQG